MTAARSGMPDPELSTIEDVVWALEAAREAFRALASGSETRAETPRSRALAYLGSRFVVPEPSLLEVLRGED